MAFELKSRRGTYLDITDILNDGNKPLSAEELQRFEDFDLIYRSTCALLYNYVPMSGHPGGSISSGRFVASLLFDSMDYDFSDPNRPDADIISYAAGHKALGLYTMWALRDEVARQGADDILPLHNRDRLQLEDLLGFRRNPATTTPLFKEFNVKALDGHPTPATPFVKLSTGASGVGVATTVGLAFGAADIYGQNAPRVHMVEGEGGMTPGRVAEAMASAGTSSLGNLLMHIDWNQASIDSDRVCRDEGGPGDYVQWDPAEFAYVNDWNVIYVPDGFDFQQVIAAQRHALTIDNGQPTAIVYKTTKGWQYGITGRQSHGAGHKLCSDDFMKVLQPLLDKYEIEVPHCDMSAPPCQAGGDKAVVEQCFWDALSAVRMVFARTRPVTTEMAGRLKSSKQRLDALGRKPRDGAPQLAKVFETVAKYGVETPPELRLEPGGSSTLRGELGKAMGFLNQQSGGALMMAAADLLGSTSISAVGKGFDAGFFNWKTNPGSRQLSIGGICEDAMAGVLAGMSTYGGHIGAGASYGAFIAPLSHIAARLHAIGCMARHEYNGTDNNPMIVVCAHAGMKTGEDGPTHADPQALSVLQDSFPKGTMVTMTAWDPAETWPLLSAALSQKPAVIAPFVTRPNEPILDRAALGLAPASAAATGVYKLREGDDDKVVVLQGSGVTYAFIQDALPILDAAGIKPTIYYVSSVELFDMLPEAEQQAIFPEAHAKIAMGITGMTKGTMYRWITSQRGRDAIMHPFQKGGFLGSGQAEMVMFEAGLDGAAQAAAVKAYLS